MNKKGFFGILIFFIILFTILIVGFMIAITLGIVDFASDTVTPLMIDIGIVDNTNVSQAAEYSFGTADKVVQSLPWVTGFMLVVMLIFSVVFAVSYDTSQSPVWIGVYIMFVVLLIFASIIMSNIYEDIYTGNDELATRLQEQTLTSFVILRAPLIFAIISIFTGIYLFTKPSETVVGGYGV